MEAMTAWERRDDIHKAFLGLATCHITHRHVQRLREDFQRSSSHQDLAAFIRTQVGRSGVCRQWPANSRQACAASWAALGARVQHERDQKPGNHE